MHSRNLTYVLALILATAPLAALASSRYLVGIPGIDDPDLNFGQYINALYALSISIAALLAVIKIIVAGVKYMLSDIVTTKQEAKKDIWGALIGLLVVVSAVLILFTINPQLTETSIFLAPTEQVSNAFTDSVPLIDCTGDENPIVCPNGNLICIAPEENCAVAVDAVPPEINERTSIACERAPGTGTVQYDCQAAISACRASGGTNRQGAARGEINCVPAGSLLSTSGFCRNDARCQDIINNCESAGGDATRADGVGPRGADRVNCDF